LSGGVIGAPPRNTHRRKCHPSYCFRFQINKATSWIDGNFIYGRGEVWANALRSFAGGRLAVSRGIKGEMPAYNNIRLPLDNYPNSVTQSVQRPEDLWSRNCRCLVVLFIAR
jgi:hypothetical protein